MPRSSRRSGSRWNEQSDPAVEAQRGPMTRLSFDDSAAYERFIGTWGRAAGAMFLDWLDPAAGADWLGGGCGTGLFTELIFKTCAPASIVGIDPAPAQVAYAGRKPIAAHASFQTADAQALPFEDAS